MDFKVLYEGVVSNKESLRSVLIWATIVLGCGLATLCWHAYQKAWSNVKTGSFAVIVSCVVVGLTVDNWYDGVKRQEQKERGALSVVEGQVSQFRKAGDGQKFDSFCVAKTCFKISEYDGGDGYKTTSSKDGVIREGQYLRLTYDQGTIFKIEERQ